MNLLKRYWINAPSKYDVVHHLNGRNVIADKDDIGYPNTKELVTVYFIDGDVVSQYVPRIYLAKGWRKPKAIPPTSTAVDCIMAQYNYLKEIKE